MPHLTRDFGCGILFYTFARSKAKAQPWNISLQEIIPVAAGIILKTGSFGRNFRNLTAL